LCDAVQVLRSVPLARLSPTRIHCTRGSPSCALFTLGTAITLVSTHPRSLSFIPLHSLKTIILHLSFPEDETRFTVEFPLYSCLHFIAESNTVRVLSRST